MNDQELLENFEASTLDAFPHEDHVRVVYLLITKYGADQAADRMITGIRNLAPRFGLPPSFIHVTRTVAWTRIVAALADGHQSSRELLASQPHLLRKDLLDDYYGWARLNSPRARRKFVEPNRRPLPSTSTPTAGRTFAATQARS